MKRSAFSTFVIVGFLAACSPQTITPELVPTKTITPTHVPGTSWQPVWADEFEQENGSAPDPQKWNHQEGGSGWGNGELEQYTSSTDNAFIQNGMLIIQAKKEYSLGRDYTSARLTT